MNFRKLIRRIWDGRFLNYEIRNKLRDRFEIRGYWFPLSEPQPPYTEYFETKIYLEEFGIEKSIQLIKALGDKVINEINESVSDRKIGVDELDLDRDETFSCNDKVDWVIYRSHEGTITIGGQRLLAKLKENWSEWEKYCNPWKNYQD